MVSSSICVGGGVLFTTARSTRVRLPRRGLRVGGKGGLYKGRRLGGRGSPLVVTGVSVAVRGLGDLLRLSLRTASRRAERRCAVRCCGGGR